MSRDHSLSTSTYTVLSPISTKMSGIRAPIAIGTAILGACYAVAQYASAHPVGLNIPVEKEVTRNQGAQGEAVKAGVAKPEEVAEKLTVERKGGDKGLRMDYK